jgi:NAD(P)-dependent dehydrogenase (short-subunit alcohol dehydrogenase family)
MGGKRWVLVTGAGSDIVRATALLLAGKGFGVYATDLLPEPLEDVRKIGDIEAFQLDITEDADVGRACDCIKAPGTGLFALINNAGIFNPGPLMALPMERFEKQYAVNLFYLGPNGSRGPFSLLKEAILTHDPIGQPFCLLLQ